MKSIRIDDDDINPEALGPEGWKAYLKLIPYQFAHLGHTLKTFAEVLPRPHPGWPTTAKTWREWGSIWRIMKSTEESYREAYLDGYADTAKVGLKAHAQAIVDAGFKPCSRSKLSEIRAAGQAGYLHKGKEGIRE